MFRYRDIGGTVKNQMRPIKESTDYMIRRIRLRNLAKDIERIEKGSTKAIEESARTT